MRYYLLVFAIVTFASPALAAEFYVVQNVADKTCSVAQEKPDGKTMLMVGTSSYSTKAEAKAAKKAAVAAGQCTKENEKD